MKKAHLGILALGLFPAAISSASQFHRIPGAMCATNGSQDDTGVYRSPTLENWDIATGKSYSCSIPLTSTTVSPITVNPATARVDYNDADANSYIACQMIIVDNLNTTVSGGYRYSCATAGGCTASSPSFTGFGYLTLPDTIASTANVVGMSVNCNLPAANATYGTSMLIGIGASTTTP